MAGLLTYVLVVCMIQSQTILLKVKNTMVIKPEIACLMVHEERRGTYTNSEVKRWAGTASLCVN